MYTVLLVTAVLLSLSIIGLVLLQHGRGADTGAAFGSGASGSVFGSRGSASFLSRITAAVVALFFANCLALAWVVKSIPPEQSIIGEIVDTTTEGLSLEPYAPEQPVIPEPDPDPAAEIPE